MNRHQTFGSPSSSFRLLGWMLFGIGLLELSSSIYFGPIRRPMGIPADEPVIALVLTFYFGVILAWLSAAALWTGFPWARILWVGGGALELVLDFLFVSSKLPMLADLVKVVVFAYLLWCPLQLDLDADEPSRSNGKTRYRGATWAAAFSAAGIVALLCTPASRDWIDGQRLSRKVQAVCGDFDPRSYCLDVGNGRPMISDPRLGDSMLQFQEVGERVGFRVMPRGHRHPEVQWLMPEGQAIADGLFRDLRHTTAMPELPSLKIYWSDSFGCTPHLGAGLAKVSDVRHGPDGKLLNAELSFRIPCRSRRQLRALTGRARYESVRHESVRHGSSD